MARSRKRGPLNPSDPTAGVRATFERLCRQGHSGPGCTVNCQAAVERLEGDWELFRDLLRFYLAGIPQLAGAVKEAIAARNAKRLEHAAHQLAGFISNFDAHAAVAAARRLQEIGRAALDTDALDDRAIEEAGTACESLDHELAKMAAILGQFDVAASKDSATLDG